MPQLADSDFTGRKGVIEVAKAVNEARCIWRETPLQDVGIDGQVEYVTPDGVATGRLVGVQIKSGASYFRRDGAGNISFRVPDKHASYWESFVLPVILVFYDPGEELMLWADARGALRRGENPVVLSPANVFDREGIHRALSLEGPLPATKQDTDSTLREMARARLVDQGISLSFLDLFSHGLTDLSRALYFSMDLFMEVGQVNAFLEGQEGGPGIGDTTYRFIDRYVAFLVARNLARVDFDSWRQMDIELQMTGKFIAPLTSEGRALVDQISTVNAALPAERRGPVVEERLVRFMPLRMEPRAVALRAIADALEDDEA